MPYQSSYQDIINQEIAGVYTNYQLNSTLGSEFELNGISLDDSVNFKDQASSIKIDYPMDTNGFYQDPNPEIIRRPALGVSQVYTQRVSIKFLKPPPLPSPGPLIIKEVRPPQLPPPPPIYIRQCPPLPPTPPPIIIREAPPKLPAAVGTQVITKMLPPIPVPPRSVIIERLPPLPPKPRDIIVERWLPYQTQKKRRVIIQRAPPPIISAPRNIIIYYEPPKPRIVRQFKNLGIQHADPVDYVARYRGQLEDSQTLLNHARQVGVVEDISLPTTTSVTPTNMDFVGEISTNNYELSSILNSTNFDSSFAGLTFLNNADNSIENQNAYQSYSSE